MLRQALRPSEHLRETLTGTWAFRARGELEAEDRFRRLARTLDGLDADERVRAMAHEAAEDERRHSLLCAELARSFGANVELRVVKSVPVGAPQLGLRERTLAEVVSLSCIAESLSVAALAAIRECAVAGAVRDVAHEILRDEVRHARLGWAHLSAESRRGCSAFLSELLPRMMAAGIPTDLFHDGADQADEEEALAFGQLSRPHRAKIFRDTFATVIFPGFDAAGLNTTAARAWLQAQSREWRCSSGVPASAALVRDRQKTSCRAFIPTRG